MMEEQLTVLVAKDESTGAILAYDCEAKGPSDVWAMKQFVRDLEDWGRRDIQFKTDGEPAIVAVQSAVAAKNDPMQSAYIYYAVEWRRREGLPGFHGCNAPDAPWGSRPGCVPRSK